MRPRPTGSGRALISPLANPGEWLTPPSDISIKIFPSSYTKQKKLLSEDFLEF
jgi:hypothetical protein